MWLPTISQSAPVRTLVYAGGTLLVAVTLPALIGVLLAGAGAGIAAWGIRRGSAGSILGGRRLELFSTRTTRLSLGVCGAILVLGQVQLWSSQLSDSYSNAVSTRARLGSVVLQAANTSYGPGTQAFLNNLPPGVAAVWVWYGDPVDTSQPRVQMAGRCPAVRALGAACDRPSQFVSPALGESRVREAVFAQAAVSDRAHVLLQDRLDFAELAKNGAELNLVSTTDRGLPVGQLQQQAYAMVPGGLQLSSIGQSWVNRGKTVQLQARWTVLWGSVGVLVIVLTTAFALAGDVVASARDLAPLAALSGRRRWLLVLTSWRAALPLTFAGTVGALAYLILPTGVETGGVYMVPSTAFAGVSAGFAAIAGGLLALWSAIAILRRSRVWRPGLD